MSDREKVITGLECCSVKQSCLECPWGGINCNDRLHLAALELLKEYETQIEQLEHDLAVTQNNLNYYVNGND